MINNATAPITYGSMVSSESDRYSSLRLLWIKVVIRAASDWVLYRESKNIKLRRWAEDAYRWLFEPSDLFNSLDNICYLFNLDKTLIRDFATNLTRDQVKKMEFLERNSVNSEAPQELESNLEDGED